MNITKDIITDLLPLYAADECSADTRELVDEYLRQHPQDAQQLSRLMSANLPGLANSPAGLDETRSLREARRRVRRRSLLLALAIFFSLVPFSFLYTDGHVYWLLLHAPTSAVVYGALGLACWTGYAVAQHRSRSL